jgi:SAM-dependent methyltransferase
MTEQPSQKPIIDVELLVDELKERVKRERAEGAYSNDLSSVGLEVPAPSLAQGFDLAGGSARVQFRPELAYSSKPVIGPVITLVKKFFVRLLFFVLDDVARQADTAVRRLEVAITAEATAREAESTAREAESTARERAMSAEAVAREAVQLDAKTISQRVDEIEAGIERLRLADRLARLERASRSRWSAPPSAGQELAPVRESASFDYWSFEERFRPEATVRERQQAYVEDLRGAKRVVDLGAGRGELVELLKAAGIDAYAVEIEPDFVDLMREKNLEVIDEDAVEHLRELEDATLDGIVASHVIEHLPASRVAELVALASEKLAPGGGLILETPNPESLVAGSINFHRDLTHVRPIHPETLAFLAESNGFAQVEIRRLSPVPDDERLPIPEGAGLEDVFARLNELLYGYQDYAVVARKA